MSEELFGIITSILLTLVGYILNRIRIFNEKEAIKAAAKDAIAAGVTAMYPVVKDLKLKGKLTQEERENIRRQAIEHGKDLGLDVLKILGPTVAHAILEQCVSRLTKPKGLPSDVEALLPLSPKTD